MKKLMSFLVIGSFTSLLTVNETSCFCSRRKGNNVDAIYNKINSAQNITARGSNLNSNASDAFTKKVILNDIGLTSSEQTNVKLSGTISDTTPSNITFTVGSGSEAKEIDKPVKWFKMSDQLTTYHIKGAAEINTSTILIATLNNGIQESTDNGDSFNKIADNVGDSITAIIKAKNNIIYVGTQANGLWKSKDDGKTFTEILNSTTIESITSIYQASDNSIWVTANNGTWKSSNGSDFEILGGDVGTRNSLVTFKTRSKYYIGIRTGGLWDLVMVVILAK